jgi:DNA-binding LacI/PurR family transcriptional regulator
MTASRPGRPATAYDVARLAGVSQSAVSRAFTPKASISEGTRAKIVEAATALNYRPNVIARSLITRRSRTIGLVAAYLQNHFYPDVLEVMSARLKERGYRILLFTADLNHPADPLLDEIIGYRVDGIILASITLSSHLAEECRAAGIPVLLFNRTAATAGISSVTGENLRGGRLIARFLAAGGHRRVAFMAGIENSSTSRDREGGFRAGLTECSLPLHRRVVGHYRFDCAAEATRALLSDPEPPDALFCANDHMALAAIEVARYELGLRVPEELSIVGFDDVGPARWASFSLTSFSQPVDGMVESAVDLIAGLVEDPKKEPRHEIVAGELVVRGSARAPSGCMAVDGRLVWRGEIDR